MIVTTSIIVPQIVGSLVALAIISIAVSMFYYMWRTLPVGTRTKVRMIRSEQGVARYLAGEISPSAWQDIIECAGNNHALRGLEAIVGPLILISDKFIADEEYFRQERDGTYHLRNSRILFDVHPLFKYLRADLERSKDGSPRRVRVWVKSKPLEKERHFYVGENPGHTCIEIYHSHGPFQGAARHTSPEVQREKLADWQAIRDCELCTELTEDTVESLLSKANVRFLPESRRDEEYARIPA